MPAATSFMIAAAVFGAIMTAAQAAQAKKVSDAQNKAMQDKARRDYEIADVNSANQQRDNDRLQGKNRAAAGGFQGSGLLAAEDRAAERKLSLLTDAANIRAGGVASSNQGAQIAAAGKANRNAAFARAGAEAVGAYGKSFGTTPSTNGGAMASDGFTKHGGYSKYD